MNDREAFTNVAAAIADWQLAAQQLPLSELFDMAATRQNSLAESLNAFNAIFLSYAADGELSIEAMRAVGEVTRQATALAIFTLGIAHGVHLTAHQN